jgi:hypothetical protein
MSLLIVHSDRLGVLKNTPVDVPKWRCPQVRVCEI